MLLNYQCRYCKLEATIPLDDEGLDMFQVEKFKPILCCNRCADSIVARRAVVDRIKKAVELLIIQRHSSNPENVVVVTKNVREALTVLTKRYATLVNEYFKKPNMWHADFVDLLMDKPRYYETILKDYFRHRRVA